MKPASFLLPASLAIFAALSSVSAAAQASLTAKQRAVVEKACANGTLSPEECQAKLGAPAVPAAAPPTTHDAAGSPPVAGGSFLFKEPHGRYTLDVPKGWKVDSTGGNLKISQGETWAIFETSSNSGQPLDVAHQAAQQMQAMYTEWQVFNQGPFTTHSNHPAAGMTVGATYNSKTGAKKVVMLFASQGAGGGHYLTMTSSTDQATGRETNGLLMQIFETVKFAGE